MVIKFPLNKNFKKKKKREKIRKELILRVKVNLKKDTGTKKATRWHKIKLFLLKRILN